MLLASLILLGLGCAIGGGIFGNDDSGVVDDSGGGGGNQGDTWRARGKGSAYLLDGSQDHSLFSIELTSCMEPREGEAYHGWLTGGSSPIYLGEIPVLDDIVLHEVELDLNAFENGYTTFQAYVSDEVPSAPGEGEILWYGEIPASAVEILEDLLVSSPESDEGSLRAMETTAEAIRDYGQAASDGFTDIDTFRSEAEAVRNGIAGEEEDVDNNGSVSTISGLEVALIGDNGQSAVILEDFQEAFIAFGGDSADEDIREALDVGYDCIQRIELHAEEAYSLAGTATVCGAESSCVGLMNRVIEELDYAIEGEDEDEDGTVELDEGTIDCAIEYMSRLMAFEVAVP
ncbi:MAG TPA: hypothetical protein QGF58_28845 [Myxococcota bacterium]|nr:hypothetical protein [Myxococcota bacterium]